MQNVVKNYEDVDSWKTIMFLYTSALKEVGTKLEILNDEFQHVHQYNPIEHIKTRVKTPESIVKKLRRYGYESSIENMVKYVNDIAGVRVICSFTSDIYRLAEMIGNQSDLKVLSIKDYIKNPKESGYKSYHMLVSVPFPTAWWTPRWRSRSGPSPWTSGPAWSIRSTTNSRETPRNISAGNCGNVRRWSPHWTTRCFPLTRRSRISWRSRRTRKNIKSRTEFYAYGGA